MDISQAPMVVPAIPIWRDPNFIVAATTLLAVIAKWIRDRGLAEKQNAALRTHDEKLDTVVEQTNGINERLRDQNARLTETVSNQARVIAGK
jgi:hypothetical protein